MPKNANVKYKLQKQEKNTYQSSQIWWQNGVQTVEKLDNSWIDKSNSPRRGNLYADIFVRRVIDHWANEIVIKTIDGQL